MRRLADLPRVLRARTAVKEAAAPAPPPVPEGWQSGPPDFVGVGAQKAGTSWWYQLLVEHPGVQRLLAGHRDRDHPKELHYFDRFWNRPFTAADAVAYAAYFPRPPGAVTGQWTPRYMHDRWVPGLLAAAAPEARLLVLVRDPVERYVSGVTHELSVGRPASPEVAQDAFRRGLYAEQLRGLLAHFRRDRVLVLQLERCRRDPAGELARTFAFLGLPPHQVPARRLANVVNRTWATKLELPEPVRETLVAAYREDALRLVELVPDLDLSLWPSLELSRPTAS